MRLTPQEIWLLMLILKDITSSLNHKDKKWKKDSAERSLVRLRELGDTIWPRLLPAKEAAFFVKTRRIIAASQAVKASGKKCLVGSPSGGSKIQNVNRAKIRPAVKARSETP